MGARTVPDGGSVRDTLVSERELTGSGRFSQFGAVTRIRTWVVSAPCEDPSSEGFAGDRDRYRDRPIR